MLSEELVDLSRLQFAITAMYHFLFVPLTLGLSFLLAIMESVYVMTGRAKGLSERQVLYGHVFRNAMLIVIAGFPASFIHAFFTGSLLIETIFMLSIFAEIKMTTAGAFGTKTLSYLIYQRVLESQNVGLGSAGGVYAIILANIVAIFLMRIVGKNLDT